MPTVNEYNGIQFGGFKLGLNRHADSSRLEGEELSEATNMRLGARGELQLRTGYVRDDNGSLTGNARFIYPWREANGTDQLVVVDGSGDIWHGPRGVNTFIDSGVNAEAGPGLEGYSIGFAGANNLIFVSGKQSTVRKWNGTQGGWTSAPDVPRGKMLHFRHNRLFSINTVEEPSRIFFSELGQPEEFGVDDWIDVLPDDGYQINASAVFADDLILFKDRAIWKLSGRTPQSFALYRIDDDRGTVATRSLTQLRGQLVFYDRDSGIWIFDGAQIQLLSQSLNDYMLANQDYDETYRVSTYSHEDRLYVSVPWEGGGAHTFVYFADTGAWTEYDTGFEGAAEYLDVRMLGLTGASGVYKATESSNVVPPSSTPIVGTFRTGWQLIGGPGFLARIRRLEGTVKADPNTTVTVRMFKDYDESAPYVTHTFDAGNSIGELRFAIDGWGNKLKAFMLEFEMNDSPFQMNQFTAFYSGGIDVRGT